MADVIKPQITVRFNALLGLRQLIDPKITRRAMMEELNAVGNKATTQIRRKLAEQTKIKYGEMMDYVKLRPAFSDRLSATIRVSSRVPTLGRFMTFYSKRPRSWRRKGWHQYMRLRVWSGLQVFPRNAGARPFVIGGRLIAVRTGTGRTPIKVLSGPNLAGGKANTGEIQRLQTGRYVKIELPVDFANRVMARIERIMMRRV